VAGPPLQRLRQPLQCLPTRAGYIALAVSKSGYNIEGSGSRAAATPPAAGGLYCACRNKVGCKDQGGGFESTAAATATTIELCLRSRLDTRSFETDRVNTQPYLHSAERGCVVGDVSVAVEVLVLLLVEPLLVAAAPI
jgi:hypothetical protein